MSNVNVMKALAKVIVALAWTDGSITIEEVNQVKELLIGFPAMTTSDWAEVDIYIDAPVGEAERQRLVAELQAALGNSGEKAFVLNALDELININGGHSKEEGLVYLEIRDAIESTNISPLGGLGRLLRSSPNHKSAVSATMPNREIFIDDYMKNRIFYNINRRLELDNSEIQISEALLWKLSLAGGLMARVANVDRNVGNVELNRIIQALRDHWAIGEIEANLVAEVAVADIHKGLDGYQLSSQFFECTTEDERLHFLDALFAVAAGNNGVSFEETEEIRAIATVLKLTHQDFITAKLKVPLELRASDRMPGSKNS